MTDTVVFPKVEAELVRVLGERLPGCRWPRRCGRR